MKIENIFTPNSSVRAILHFSLGLLLVGGALSPSIGMSAVASVILTPNPISPEVGENTLDILLKDSKDQGIDKAELILNLYMPAMGAMPRMEEKSKIVAKGKGVYQASYELPMGGSWEIDLSIKEGSEESIFHYSLTTGLEGITDKNMKMSGDRKMTSTNMLEIGPRRLQLIGVTFEEAKRTAMERVIRTVGVVEQDRTHREDVTIRYSGYIAKLFSGRVGDMVEKGQALFSIYSPELVTAQSEFILASKPSGVSQGLSMATEDRLKNLGMTAQQIETLKKTGKPQREILVRSPLKGTILEINASEGSAVSAGQSIVIVGDLSKSFIVARVFQQDVGDIKVGQQAEYFVPNSGGIINSGKVDLVFPQIEQGAGTANVRVQSLGADLNLKPGTYVDLRFSVQLGVTLNISSDALLYSGLHSYVFIDQGEGVLEPREVFPGRFVGDVVEITSGLKEGERVVKSGAFLLSSEAQLRSALPKWTTRQ